MLDITELRQQGKAQATIAQVVVAAKWLTERGTVAQFLYGKAT